MPERAVYKANSHVKPEGHNGSRDGAGHDGQQHPPERSGPAAPSLCLQPQLTTHPLPGFAAAGAPSVAVTPALPSPRKAAGGESRQRTSSAAGAAGSRTLAGTGFALAQHPSSVGRAFPAALRVRLLKLP